MRVDFDRVGQLAYTTFDFVRAQSKSALNQLTKTATELFKHFLGSAGGNKQAVTGALEFPGKARQQTRAFSDEELNTFSARLDEQKASLLGDLGLLIDEDKLQQLEGSVVQHPDGLHLNNGMTVHGIGKEDGCADGSRHLMSVSIGNEQDQQMVMVPVTVLKRSRSQEELTGDVFSHLERTSSVGWGEHGPAMFCGDVNQSRLKQLESGVKALQRTQSLPNMNTGSSRASTSAEPAALPELTLAGKSPAAVPKTENDGVFVDKQKTNNACGVAAINGYFQAPVLGVRHAVQETVNAYSEVLNEKNARSGLFHPKVQEAMTRGEMVIISRDDFFTSSPEVELSDLIYPTLTADDLENDFGLDRKNSTTEQINQARLAKQWRAYFNYKYAGQDNRVALIENSREITITPDEWLSNFAGLGFDSMVKLTNDLLTTKGKGRAWKDYPNQVDGFVFQTVSQSSTQNSEEQESKKLQQLNQLCTGLQQRNNVKHLICMSGSGVTGHYFALVKDAAGQWLKLDGLHSDQTSGIYKVDSSNVAKPRELLSQLLAWGVSGVIADEELIAELKKPVTTAPSIP